ncbi:(Na+)-NQR maturation NqrM [Ostreibacterium oceani]|uniref:(Na+)-NQR maturation NqrM n=1 Tax=Ostreibacterium oceani TaxID=2654998 RepID=A0A6N7EQT1_9GAMM|nr:(Na+)-NQR maturation NqrM [Ostreibacterium oceani]MPV85214.1 (Na+)-NQR maturation NqrM [Ostreibacterium oceani]
MIEFLIVVLVMLLMMAMMGVGVMFKRKPISGSCGGLGNAGIEKACDCDKPCDEKLAAMSEANALPNQAASSQAASNQTNTRQKIIAARPIDPIN